MNIAFCVNLRAFCGLGPTISSLIRNVSDSTRLKIWFLCAGINDRNKQNLTELLAREHFKGAVHFVDFDPLSEFGELRSLHGDWTAYGRLLLPHLVTEDQILYLDADLIIEIDLLSIEHLDFQQNAIAAVSLSTLRHALDNTFLNGKLGIPLETSYFNSGILFLNLKKWREENYKDECLSIARKYPNDLISHDQTLLNAIFGDKFNKLPKQLNSPWYAFSVKPKVADKMIFHFLGSPKPWDIGASLLHSGHNTWKMYEDKEWARLYNRLTLDSIFRAWNIRRSYIRVIKKKFHI